MTDASSYKAPDETIQADDQFSEIELLDYLDRYHAYFQSRKSAKKAIERGFVLVNGRRGRTNYNIRKGDTIEIFKNEQENRPKIDLKIEVLYEDDFLALVNKPSGILVNGNRKRTLENALPGNLKASPEKDALTFPEAIHRIDFQTTGIVLIGKTATAVRLLNKMFEERQIEKRYTAICIGEMPETGRIESDIDGKKAVSEFTILKKVQSPKYKWLNLVEIKIESGRRHQIRKQMFELGNPILGDPDYGFEGLMPKGRGMFLHASWIKFRHPIHYIILEVDCSLPLKFLKINRIIHE